MRAPGSLLALSLLYLPCLLAGCYSSRDPNGGEDGYRRATDDGVLSGGGGSALGSSGAPPGASQFPSAGSGGSSTAAGTGGQGAGSGVGGLFKAPACAETYEYFFVEPSPCTGNSSLYLREVAVCRTCPVTVQLNIANAGDAPTEGDFTVEVMQSGPRGLHPMFIPLQPGESTGTLQLDDVVEGPVNIYLSAPNDTCLVGPTEMAIVVPYVHCDL